MKPLHNSIMPNNDYMYGRHILSYQISCIQRNYMSLLLEEKNVRQAIKISPHLEQQQRQHEITTKGKEKKHQQHVHSDCIVPNLFNSFL